MGHVDKSAYEAICHDLDKICVQISRVRVSIDTLDSDGDPVLGAANGQLRVALQWIRQAEDGLGRRL